MNQQILTYLTYHRWSWDHIQTIPITSLTRVNGSGDMYWKSKSDTSRESGRIELIGVYDFLWSGSIQDGEPL